jgi:hypothetical protein
MSRMSFAMVPICTLLFVDIVEAQPRMPHIDVQTPSIQIPSIELPNRIFGIEIGHKTNKWDIRHDLEKDGWIVAYGKEIGYQEYKLFADSVELSIATANPGPALAYLAELLAESAEVLARNAGERFGEEFKKIAKQELIGAMHDAIFHGRVRTIRITDYEIQLGCSEYKRSESGVKLPPTYQPFLRMRFSVNGANNGPNRPSYRWVTTVYNPTDVRLTYLISYGNNTKQHHVNPKGWSWHAIDGQDPAHPRISFDTGPAGGHNKKDYNLNAQRVSLNIAASEDRGEPYYFAHNPKKGWDLYRGRPLGLSRNTEGHYIILSNWNNLAFDVPNGNRVPGLEIIQWPLHARDAQQWRVVPVPGNGPLHYKIINNYTGLVLGVSGQSRADRAKIVQETDSGAVSQHWQLIPNGIDGSYTIVSRWSGKAVDIPFGSKERGTKLELVQANRQVNQAWRIIRLDN